MTPPTLREPECQVPAATPAPTHVRTPPLWRVLLLTGMAGGLGWGIRGQYGHETGARLPGLLVALVLALLFLEDATSLFVARAAALTALGISFGGSMTYAQTVGLTQDAPLIGNGPALAWGMTGLALKGALWVGLAGAFLGMGLSRKPYRMREVALLFLLLIALMFLGAHLLNEPFQPNAHRLPRVYFSMTEAWEPGRAGVRPRRENWGGLLLALLGLLAYAQAARRDLLVRNLALWGMLAGGAGWVLGQSIQSAHAWNADWFQRGWAGRLEPYMNWWNLMETTFGALLGAGLGLGVWLNRARIASGADPLQPELGVGWEVLLIALQAATLVAWEFLRFPLVEVWVGAVFTVGLLPAAAIAGGRYFPYAFTLPLLAVPIAGKTLQELCYKTHQVPAPLGWALFVALPLLACTAAAWLWGCRALDAGTGREFARRALLLCSWLYFSLNFAFFRFPWPWSAPTYRSSNTLLFALCLAGLTLAALRYGRGPLARDGLDPAPEPI